MKKLVVFVLFCSSSGSSFHSGSKRTHATSHEGDGDEKSAESPLQVQVRHLVQHFCVLPLSTACKAKSFYKRFISLVDAYCDPAGSYCMQHIR